MAHWAEIDENNRVIRVLVIDSSTEEEEGRWFTENLGGRWIKTSYNTYAGEHILGGIPLRKNYAGVDYTYDEGRDAFIPPRPTGMNSWIVDEDTCLWKTPIPKPETSDQDYWFWDENTVSWVLDPELDARGRPKLT